jgi:hypothetical protein
MTSKPITSNDNDGKVHEWKAIVECLKTRHGVSISVRKAQELERLAENPLPIGEDDEGVFVRLGALDEWAREREQRLTRARRARRDRMQRAG